MSVHRFIEIDGKRYLWRDLVQLRREQKQAQELVGQPVLFELKDDSRPVAARTAAGPLQRTVFVLRLKAGPSDSGVRRPTNESLHSKT